MHKMKLILKSLVLACVCCLVSNQLSAQVTYELQIDSIVGLPDTIEDGQEVTFFMIVSMNSALFYQGDIFVELEYGGQFYRVDTAISVNGFLGPNSPNTIQAHHRFSTDDDLNIGDNVVVVWPRIGDGTTPSQEVINPHTQIINLVEPDGISLQPIARIRESFVSPNPAITGIQYNLNHTVTVLESILLDVSGRVVMRSHASTQIDISSLPAGVYFVEVITEKGDVYSDKLLISR